MPTTVHIPGELLAAVDKRARALKVSRNRLIVRALARDLREPSGWSPEFVARLRAVDAGTAADVDDLMQTVTRARRSKQPPRL